MTDPIPLIADMNGVIRVGTNTVTLDTVVTALSEAVTVNSKQSTVLTKEL